MFQGKTMSRADFYDLMGIAAIEYSIDLNNDNCPGGNECLTPMVGTFEVHFALFIDA